MNLLVLLFFIHSTVATLLLGWKFSVQSDEILKKFGRGFVLNGVAYMIWTAAVLVRPENLELWTSIGALVFMGTLFYLLSAGSESLESSTRRKVMGTGAILVGILFILRTFFFPSEPYFSEDGLFFFNVHPVAIALYIFLLSVAAFSAFREVVKRIRAPYASVVEGGFISLVIGGFILLISVDRTLLYINSWVMSISYLALWISLLFGGKRIWLSDKVR